jgi:hypothetical protein
MRIYNTAVWRRGWRPLVLAQEPLCPGYPTGWHGSERVRTTEVDHVISVRSGGPTVRSNLRALCGLCHRKKTQAEDGARSWR